jgi:hypothetical protein
LEKLTVDINATVTNIGSEVVKGPQDWNVCCKGAK